MLPFLYSLLSCFSSLNYFTSVLSQYTFVYIKVELEFSYDKKTTLYWHASQNEIDALCFIIHIMKQRARIIKTYLQ